MTMFCVIYDIVLSLLTCLGSREMFRMREPILYIHSSVTGNIAGTIVSFPTSELNVIPVAKLCFQT